MNSSLFIKSARSALSKKRTKFWKCDNFENVIWNINHKGKVCKQIVNFTVFYPDDSSSGPHCLSPDNYNTDTDNDSPNHTWLLIEPSNH